MAKAQQSANGRAPARPGGPGSGTGQAGRGGRGPAQPARKSSSAPAAPGAGNGAARGGPARPDSRARARDAVRNGDTAPVAPAVRPPGNWLTGGTWALALIGLGLSVYLTITHLHPAALLCSAHGLVNCEAVTTSSQSKVFGIFPVAELGLAFYVFLAVICTPWAWRMKRVLRLGPVSIGNSELRWIRLGSIIVGMGFVLYLLYVELIQLGNICLYCTGVHIATFFLFVFILFDSVFRQGPTYSAASASAKRTKD